MTWIFLAVAIVLLWDGVCEVLACPEDSALTWAVGKVVVGGIMGGICLTALLP